MNFSATLKNYCSLSSRLKVPRAAPEAQAQEQAPVQTAAQAVVLEVERAVVDQAQLLEAVLVARPRDGVLEDPEAARGRVAKVGRVGAGQGGELATTLRAEWN